MARAIRMGEFASRPELGTLVVAPAHQAYRILHLGYFLLPLVAGVDKFTNRLTDWSGYLAPAVTRPIQQHVPQLMMGIGVVEIAAALLVAFKPSVGAYVVAAWLVAIIGNLYLGGFYDVALRDFGLMLGAIALGRLAQAYSREQAYVEDD